MAAGKYQDSSCKNISMKRKVFAKGKKQNFKRFKRTPKFIKDNPENKIAREKEKDPYLFTDSEDDITDDLGMGLDLTDLPSLDENIEDKSKDLIALTQDSVRPLFADEASYDEEKLKAGLMELKYSAFRPNQKETIKRILSGRSTLFISPTGSGKSLCYQLPALLYWRHRKYMTIVVSPLISLMEDQISSLPKCLKAVTLHSNQNPAQRQANISQLVNQEAQIVFISPEAIVGGLLDLDDLKNLPPVGFVCIDEAHCLSEWSHNFRPAYLQFVRVLKERMNIKTFLALTATSTKDTAFAISRSLVINPEDDVIGSTTIPSNLILSVSFEKDKPKALINLLKSRTFRIMPSIIIYCNRREDTEMVARSIRTGMQDYSTTMETPDQSKLGSSDADSPNSSKEHSRLSWDAEAYHAGLNTEVRRKVQRKFVKGEIRVVVATVAFGMGIHKSNIRAVIHYDMPGSFEGYVQEIGRAGRDGQVAQCHLFLKADRTDLVYQQRNIYSSVVGKSEVSKLVRFLFRPCCHKKQIFVSAADTEKLDKLNKLDPPSPDSIINKHRACKGHEIAFPVEEASSAVNLWPESIMTILHQIQQAYPQLLIKQFPTCRSTCNLFCYKGPEQMKSLEEKFPPVKSALFLDRKKNSRVDIPTKLKFDVMEVASFLGKSSADVIRTLRKTVWELVEETGRFRRSQVRVSFEGNSFHVLAAGDLTDEELKEVERFVIESIRRYEKRERERIAKVFNTFRDHCITVDQMNDKSIRLNVSDRLKAALNSYFSTEPIDTPMQSQNSDTDGTILNDKSNDPSEETGRISAAREDNISASARAFISAHGKEDFKPDTIAKIFQGISTPNYPAEHWGRNRKWWRLHLDVDFKTLRGLIQDHMYP